MVHCVRQVQSESDEDDDRFVFILLLQNQKPTNWLADTQEMMHSKKFVTLSLSAALNIILLQSIKN